MSYNIHGWLEKNKDAKNAGVFDLFRTSTNPLLSLLYQNNAEEGLLCTLVPASFSISLFCCLL